MLTHPLDGRPWEETSLTAHLTMLLAVAAVVAATSTTRTEDLAPSPESSLYHYRAIVKEVHDGDTITVDIDLGFHTWIHDEHIRLAQINAPEVIGASKAAGIASRDFLSISS